MNKINILQLNCKYYKLLLINWESNAYFINNYCYKKYNKN